MNTRLTIPRLAAALATLVGLSACMINDNERARETRSESQSVDLGGAKSVRVEIKMGAGKLKVGGGVKAANGLLDADFTYNVPRWKPEVNYSPSGDQGRLTIEQPSGGSSHGNTRYDWDLHLAEKVPMEMRVEMGAGPRRPHPGLPRAHQPSRPVGRRRDQPGLDR